MRSPTIKNVIDQSNSQDQGKSFRFLFVSAPFGGIEVSMQNILLTMSQHPGIEISHVRLDYQPRELISRIPPISMNWTLKGGLVARLRIEKLEKYGKVFDAALFNHTVPATFLRRFRREVPMFLTLDVTQQTLAEYSRWCGKGKDVHFPPMELLKQKVIESVYSDAVHIFAWSSLVERSLVRDNGVNAHKISVVPPGIDLCRWRASRNNDRSPKQKDQPIRILFVGSDFERKGGHLLVRLAQRKEFRNDEFHFVTRTKIDNLAPNCIIHRNIEPNSCELLELYNGASVFVLPTRADLAPTMAVCEAMAMGLPVIVTPVGGMEEVVEDGDNGFVVPVNDENALANKLMQLTRDSQLRTKMGNSARKYAESRFDIRKNGDIILEHLCSAARSRRP